MVNNFDPSCKTLRVLHKKYIRNTEKESIVQEKTMFLCNLTYAVKNGLTISTHRVYVTSKALKHLYDKKPASTYDSILNSMLAVVKYPNNIYENKKGKKADFLFVKKVGSIKLIVSLQILVGSEGEKEIYVVTSFPTKENYLKSCTLIWSWRGGIPSS